MLSISFQGFGRELEENSFMEMCRPATWWIVWLKKQ